MVREAAFKAFLLKNMYQWRSKHPDSNAPPILFSPPLFQLLETVHSSPSDKDSLSRADVEELRVLRGLDPVWQSLFFPRHHAARSWRALRFWCAISVWRNAGGQW